jgi:hypothetical protein
MTKPGTPDKVVLEPIDAGVETTIGVDADVGNKEIVTNLEQEERTISLRAKPLGVVLHKTNNLIL